MALGSLIRRNIQPTLYQSYQDYINQAMPDISGIFRSAPITTSTPVTIDSSTEAQPVGLTPQQLALLYPQNVDRGGGERGTGFGAFGNLDPGTAKEFNVEVYDEEVGDFVPTTLTGYKNVNSGLYQTIEGKNLNPAFSNKGIQPGIIGTIANMLGFEQDTVGGYVPGSIKGKYDTFGNLVDDTTSFIGGLFTSPEEFRADYRGAGNPISAADRTAGIGAFNTTRDYGPYSSNKIVEERRVAASIAEAREREAREAEERRAAELERRRSAVNIPPSQRGGGDNNNNGGGHAGGQAAADAAASQAADDEAAGAGGY